jgi:hypothetical protein
MPFVAARNEQAENARQEFDPATCLRRVLGICQ